MFCGKQWVSATITRVVATAGITMAIAVLLGGGIAARASKPGNADVKLRFVVYGDTRDGHEIHRALVALIRKQKPDLVLQTGDLVHRGSRQDLWRIYDDITGQMRKEIPVYPARGNHDVGGPGYEDRVPTTFTSGNKLYYSFDSHGSHFIALAIDENTAYGSNTLQYRWLKEDLAKAEKAGGNIFVFFHVPPYSIGSHGSDMEVRSTLCPLFERFHVRAVLNGHDHIYYRTIRNGIPYIVTGGGGAPLYTPDPARGAIKGDRWEKVNHIVVCDIDGGNVTFTALRADGSVIDRFSAP